MADISVVDISAVEVSAADISVVDISVKTILSVQSLTHAKRLILSCCSSKVYIFLSVTFLQAICPHKNLSKDEKMLSFIQISRVCFVYLAQDVYFLHQVFVEF